MAHLQARGRSFASGLPALQGFVGFKGLGAPHVSDVVLAHGLDQVDRADDVVRVVQHRLRDRLAHRLAPGKVDDGVEPGAFPPGAPLGLRGHACLLGSPCIDAVLAGAASIHIWLTGSACMAACDERVHDSNADWRVLNLWTPATAACAHPLKEGDPLL